MPMPTGRGLNQDVYHNRFGGVAGRTGWGGLSSPNNLPVGGRTGQPTNQDQQGSLSGSQDLTSHPNGSSMTVGPPDPSLYNQPMPTRQGSYESASVSWTPPSGSIRGTAGQLPPPGYNTASGPDGSVYWVPGNATPTPTPTSTPTPSGPSSLAPTTSQVQSNPSAWAGTSFDPARIVDPKNFGTPGGANNPVLWPGSGVDPNSFNTSAPNYLPPLPNVPAQEIQEAVRAGSGGNGLPTFEGRIASPESVLYNLASQSGAPMPAGLPTRAQGIQGLGLQATGDPNTFITNTGAMYNSAPVNNASDAEYQAWLRRVNSQPNAAYLTALANR